MTIWTIDLIATRFIEAADTARSLPPVRAQGYFNVWPIIVRQEWERFAVDDRPYRPSPPTPTAIDRMLETMRWVQWLELEQRRLVWMRAKDYEWQQIGKRFGYCRTTAWRQWKAAITIIVLNLNAPCSPQCAKQKSQRE